MKTKPAQLDAQLTLEALAGTGALAQFAANEALFVECEPGWFALITAGALQQWVVLLHDAVNRRLAAAMLATPLGELLRPIATQSDAPPATTSRRRPIKSAEDLLRALGVDPAALNAREQSAMLPDFATDSFGAPSGKGDDGEETAGEVSKGELGSAESDAAPMPAEALLREEIRLDVVTPETAVIDEPFDMAVAIRQPASPALTIDDLPKLTSTLGEVYRSGGQDLVKYRVEVEVDDCDVKPARYDFLLAKGRDSIVQYFQLTPRRAGNLSIVVNAYQADSATLAATTRVRLKAGVAIAGDSPAPEAQADAVKVYDVLTSRFSLSDVEDLALRLGVNWEELAGDTLSAKCRALLAYCSNRGKFDQLRQLVKAARPEADI